MNTILLIFIFLGVLIAFAIILLARMMFKARRDAERDFNFSTYDVACAGDVHSNISSTAVAASDVNSTFLSSKGTRIPVDQYHRLIVRGNSMSLCNISDGDLIFVKKEFKPASLRENLPQILVIKRRSASADEVQYKVRRTWLTASVSDLISDQSSGRIFAPLTTLAGFSALVNSPSSPGLQAMIEDFFNVRLPKYLQDYPEATSAESAAHQVVISTTLDTASGKIHFSIHPQSNILGSVSHIFSVQDN